MNLKPHAPLAISVLVIVLTQVLCAWWIGRAIERADNGSAIESVEGTLSGIAQDVGRSRNVATGRR